MCRKAVRKESISAFRPMKCWAAAADCQREFVAEVDVCGIPRVSAPPRAVMVCWDMPGCCRSSGGAQSLDRHGDLREEPSGAGHPPWSRLRVFRFECYAVKYRNNR